MSNSHRNAGFTLVELAIVLVIIGLLVGGVLVGQDLIRAAEINSTTTQITKYDSAANTFRTRYNGYPGDLVNPARYPIASTNSGGAALGSPNKANGDNVIQQGDCTDANGNGYGGESSIFWTHLSQSNLIPDAANAITDFAAVAAVNPFTDGNLPQARLGNGNRFHITNSGGRNYYVLAQFASSAATTCTVTANDAMTPQTAFQLDSKSDDGNAMTGSIISVLNANNITINTTSAATIVASGGGSTTPDTTGTDDCFYGATGAYATNTELLAQQMECQLRIRASF